MARSAVVLIYILALIAVSIHISWAQAGENILSRVMNSSEHIESPSINISLTNNTTSNNTTSNNTTSNITLSTSADTTSDQPENTISNLTSHAPENAALLSTLDERESSARKVKVLRAGLEKVKPLEALGGRENRSYNRSVESMQIDQQSKAAFNLSQRLGSVALFTANTDTTTPLFSRDQRTRKKPIYEAPDNLSSREVYDTSGYPAIMLASSIP